MTKREKAVIDKIIDKIITCVELNQRDYNFLYISKVSTHNRLKDIETDFVIEIDKLFGEGS